MTEFPSKSLVVEPPKKFVRRWRVWIGDTAYKPMTLTHAAAFARRYMWGQTGVITLEPVNIEVKARKGTGK